MCKVEGTNHEIGARQGGLYMSLPLPAKQCLELGDSGRSKPLVSFFVDW